MSVSWLEDDCQPRITKPIIIVPGGRERHERSGSLRSSAFSSPMSWGRKELWYCSKYVHISSPSTPTGCRRGRRRSPAGRSWWLRGRLRVAERKTWNYEKWLSTTWIFSRENSVPTWPGRSEYCQLTKKMMKMMMITSVPYIYFSILSMQIYLFTTRYPPQYIQ